MRGLGSTPIGGNILSLDFCCFHAVKTKMTILAFLCVCEKPDWFQSEVFQLGVLSSAQDAIQSYNFQFNLTN